MLSYINKVYSYLFALLCFIIPFEENFKAIPNILIGVLIGLSFFLFKRQDLKLIFSKKSILMLYVFFGYLVVLTIIRGELTEDLFILKKMVIPIVLVPLSFLVSNLRLIKNAFISSTFLAVLISLIQIIIFVYSSGSFDFSNGEYINNALISERLYIGLCCNFSFVLISEYYFESKSRNKKILFGIGASLLVGFIFLIAGRIAILSLISIILLLVFNKIGYKYRLVFITAFVIFIAFTFLFNKNLSDRFFKSNDKLRDGFFEKISLHEPRVDIWKGSFQIFKNSDNVIFGEGFFNVREKLVSYYAENIEIDHRRQWFINSRFNTHNQFFDILLSTGIIGVILFCILLYFLCADNRYNIFFISLIVALFLLLFVENIFNRQIGVYLFSLALIFINYSQNNINKLEKSVTTL